MNLSQGPKSVRKHAAEFEVNTGRLHSLDRAILMQLFIWGLHRDIVARASILRPTSLSYATGTSEEIELAIKISCRIPVKHSRNTSQEKYGSASVNTYSKGNPKDRWRQRGGRKIGQPSRSASDPRPQRTRPKQTQKKHLGSQGPVKWYESGQIAHSRSNCHRLRSGGIQRN